MSFYSFFVYSILLSKDLKVFKIDDIMLKVFVIYERYFKMIKRKVFIMKKIFTQRLFCYMLVALFLTIIAIFVLQTVVSQNNNITISQNKLEDVKAKLANNELNIEQLTENLSQDNLANCVALEKR